LLFFSLCATIRDLSLFGRRNVFSLQFIYISLLFALFRSRAFFFLQRAHSISLSLSLSLSRSFVSDGQKRIDGKREKERVIKGDFEMTNTSCFVFPRERETREEEKKSQNFFFDRERSKKRQKNLFLDARALRMSHLHKVKEKKR